MESKAYISRVALLVTGCLVAAAVFLYSNSTLEGRAVGYPGANGAMPGKVQLNGLSLNGLSLNALSYNDLANTPDSAKQLEALAHNDEGRELLRVLAACSLPEGEMLEVSTDIGTSSFSGSLGLAPEWQTAALSEQGQRWVSACVMAHVNAVGAHVPVSLRGDHPSLRPTIQEANNYRIEEGAFFGNLFGEKPYAASCVGNHGAGSPYLKERLCATDVIGSKSICGFVSAGQCEEVCDVKDQDGQQIYVNCRLSDDTAASEVITVLLTESVSG